MRFRTNPYIFPRNPIGLEIKLQHLYKKIRFTTCDEFVLKMIKIGVMELNCKEIFLRNEK